MFLPLTEPNRTKSIPTRVRKQKVFRKLFLEFYFLKLGTLFHWILNLWIPQISNIFLKIARSLSIEIFVVLLIISMHVPHQT